MINLLWAESARLWARRMTRFFPIGLSVLFVVGVVIAYLVIANDDASSVDFVDDIAGGVEATFLLGPITSILPLMAFVIGASYIGADVKTGMLEQILTWEPRRLRLLAARVIAVIVGVGVLAMLLAAFMVLLLFGLASLTGTTDGASAEFWGNVAMIVVRTGLAAGLFGAFGLGVTLLVNNSIASIVGFVIYWFVIESFLVTAFLPKLSPYLPIANADAFASGSDVERLTGSLFNDSFDFVYSHSYLSAGLLLAVWVLVAVSGAGLLFARRDID